MTVPTRDTSSESKLYKLMGFAESLINSVEEIAPEELKIRAAALAQHFYDTHRMIHLESVNSSRSFVIHIEAEDLRGRLHVVTRGLELAAKLTESLDKTGKNLLRFRLPDQGLDPATKYIRVVFEDKNLVLRPGEYLDIPEGAAYSLTLLDAMGEESPAVTGVATAYEAPMP
jgi:hypothetical protein